MRVVYSLLIALSTPFALLYFALRGLRDRAYTGRWAERFGFVDLPGVQEGVLLHAASVGEFNAASPLITRLLDSYPELPLTVTTLTPTGSERVKQVFADRVSHSYIPIDLPAAVSRFLDRLQPRLIIVMETEIWPNLYLGARRQGIPLVVANGRLSPRSLNRLQRAPRFAKEVLQSVAWLGAQSQQDLERLLECGADPARSIMTGNLKFDLRIPASFKYAGEALRSRWRQDRLVLVAGSTHEADEDVVIPTFITLLESLPDALLVLAPRHPERFRRAADALRAAGLRVSLGSQPGRSWAQAQCLVVDAMGELLTFYAGADVAFVGGSFGDQGGHNALEPAALGKPVLLGPNTQNAGDITDQLLAAGAALRVRNQQEFLHTVEQLMRDGARRDRMGRAGLSLMEKNKGALDLTLDAIGERL